VINAILPGILDFLAGAGTLRAMYATLFRHVLFPIYESRIRGRSTLTRLAELERSQWQSEESVREQSFRRMVETLSFAEREVPFYRRRFAAYGVRARDVKAPEDLARFPVLTKADLRIHADELVAEGFRGKLHPSGTSGSTGEPVRFAYDHATYERRMAAAARSDGWAGGSLGEREVHVWGTMLQHESTLARAKRRAYELVLRKKMVSAFDMSERRLAAVVDAMSRYEPRLVIGYATPLYHLARYALAHGRDLPAVRGVVTTAERLFAHQREAIERAFGAKVFDRYGCREMMLIASECDRHEGKHINAENVFVEVYTGDRPSSHGQSGEIVVTDLVSRSMPLIRYKNGDLATRSPKACSCGRGLPMLASVEGRVLDMLIGPDGQALAGEFFPHLLKDHPEIDRFQVHQARDHTITIKLVAGRGFTAALPQLITHKLRELLGPRAKIAVEVVTSIPLTQGGKHRLIVSEAAPWRGGLGESASP
jgi:phenylacetate-CoA ligase